MSKFDKNLSKYAKKYIKEIERQSYPDKEELVFKTIALLSVNSLIYFIEGLNGVDSSYSGIKTKQWYSQLKNITESDVRSILIEITQEFLDDEQKNGSENRRSDYASWAKSFEKIGGEPNDSHLIDRVFPFLYLEQATRNEYPFLTFSEIFSSLFVRLDETIEKNLQFLEEISKS